MAVVPTLTAEPVTGYRLTVAEHDPGRTTIYAAGELDLAARNALAQVLREQEGVRRRIVRLDLSDVTFLDCSCLGVLVASHGHLLDLDGHLALTGVSEFVARIVRITGLEGFLVVIPADQDPFGTVLSARPARRPRIPTQQRPDSTSSGSSARRASAED